MVVIYSGLKLIIQRLIRYLAGLCATTSLTGNLVFLQYDFRDYRDSGNPAWDFSSHRFWFLNYT